MGMKPNQRVALTKELVHRAMIELLKRQEIHRISIRELCQIAGINRTTFYNHYGSQYDVLAEIRDWYLRDIAEAIESTDLQDPENLWSRVSLVLNYMEQNLEISRLLIHNNIDETFAHRLFSLPKIEDMLAETLKESVSSRAYRDVVSFVISGSYKLVQNWIAEANRCSPAEMALLILRLANAVCNADHMGLQ